MTPSILTEVGPLALRSITRTIRQPPLVVAGIVFPLLLYGFNVGGLSVATKLPGFPTKSYATFALGLPLAYCGIYAVTVAGTQLGEDIRTGFLKRLSLTRLRSAALILGQLAGVLSFAVLQAVIYLGVGFAAGAHVAAGAGGAFVIVGLCGLYAVALGAVGQVAALRTGSGEAVQGLFPLLMASLFMSSVNLPRNLIHAGWFRDIATYNPVSYLVEAPRSLLVDGWNGEALALGFGVALAILAAALLLTATTLRGGAVRAVGGGGAPRRTRRQPASHGDEGDQPARAAPQRAPRPGATVTTHGAADFWTVTLGLARRQLARIIKSPALLLPALLFPLFLFAAFAGGLSAINKAPNFDYYDYTAFQFVYVLFQASGAAGVQTGLAIAQDFESGFARRLMLSSRGRLPLILGYALAALVRAALINVILLVIALATGMSVDASAGQLVGLFGLSLLFNLAASLLASGTALRVRSLQAGPVIQVPMIVALFLVPVYAPRKLLVGWVHAVANVNPVTRLLEAGRGFMAGHEVSVALAYGLGVGLVVLFGVWSLSGMRSAEAAGGAAAGRG